MDYSLILSKSISFACSGDLQINVLSLTYSIRQRCIWGSEKWAKLIVSRISLKLYGNMKEWMVPCVNLGAAGLNINDAVVA